jgi:hypothetical protein
MRARVERAAGEVVGPDRFPIGAGVPVAAASAALGVHRQDGGGENGRGVARARRFGLLPAAVSPQMVSLAKWSPGRGRAWGTSRGK